MSNYNADIRIGVVGQSKLKTLQTDLNKVNASVKKLNKALVLKTRAQTIKLNTKGANTAIKQLEDRINKLGRTVTVNVRANEQKGSSRSQGGGGGGAAPFSIALTQQAQKQQKALSQLADTTVEVRGANNKLQQVNSRAAKYYDDLNSKVKERNDLLTEQAKNIKDVADVETSKNAQARTANQNRIFGGQLSKAGNPLSPAQAQGFTEQRIQGAGRRIGRLNKEIDTARTKYANLTRVQRGFWNQENKRVRDASEAWGRYNERIEAATKSAEKNKKLRKGAFAGAGVAASSAFSSVPVLGDAATGGLAAGFSGGSVAAGALAGAAVGLVTAIAALGKQAAITRAEFDKLQISLELAAGDDSADAMKAIQRVVEDFNAPLVDTTEQFTKLYAASQGSGIAFSELKDLFVGLSAANKAYAGDAEDLNGILRAFTQIISKGTVQSEELKGQVGERLPGAFKKAADSLGLTTAQLQKALEQGEIQSADFVKKFGKYMLQYEDDAKIIAKSPAEAGARLKTAMDKLLVNLGPVFAAMGAAFQDFATTAINALIPLANFVNELFAKISQAPIAIATAQRNEALQEFRRADKDDWDYGLREKNLATAVENLNGKLAERDELEAALERRSKRQAANTIKPTTLDDPKTKTGGGGSKSGPSDTTAQTRVEIQLQQELLRIEKEKYDLIGKEASLQDFDLQRQQLKAELAANLQKIDQDNITAASKIAEKELERLKYSTDLQAIKNAEKEFTIEQTEAFEEQVKELENAIALESAVTDELKRQAELKIAMAEIEGQKLNPKREAELKRLTENLFQVRADNADPLNQYFNQLKERLGDTRGQIAELAQTIETELASAMSRSITGLIDGTTTAQEAFSEMFANIGKAFIDMATEMIAKALIMQAVGAVTAMFGGGGGGAVAVDPLSGWSGGGYTGNAPRTGGVDGRGGFPAILHPQETVIDHHGGASGALGRYSAGNASTALAMAPMAANVTYSGPTLNFNGDDYIPRSEAPALVAAGAKQGQARAMNTLKNSRSQRQKLGL